MSRLVLGGHHVYRLCPPCAAIKVSLAPRAEGDRSCSECEEGVIATDADVLTRKHFRTALTHDDFSCRNCGAMCALHAEILRLGVA